jgi:hypothetical protein
MVNKTINPFNVTVYGENVWILSSVVFGGEILYNINTLFGLKDINCCDQCLRNPIANNVMKTTTKKIMIIQIKFGITLVRP